MSGAALLAGYGLDQVLGDPASYHPVAGFGRLAAAAERLAYAPSRARGAAVCASLVAGTALYAAWLDRGPRRNLALAAITCGSLGGRSLLGVATEIAGLLEAGELDPARAKLPWLCGRDPDALDRTGLCRAVVESVAENTGDAVVGPLLWGALAGAPGVAGYRAANTLDAMFGHRSERYEEFGWASARLDDQLSRPVARLAALLAVALAPQVGGSRKAAATVARRDGPKHPSPNAGPLEAAFAGALGLRLGGPLTYGGRAELRPWLGDGRDPVPTDIARAVRLSHLVGLAAAPACAATRELIRR